MLGGSCDDWLKKVRILNSGDFLSFVGARDFSAGFLMWGRFWDAVCGLIPGLGG
jgi:hypothetical protein